MNEEFKENILTIIVPAKPGSFLRTRHHWKAIRIAKYKRDLIKYIVIYESGKISKITHYAEVRNIESLPKQKDEKTPKCKVNIIGSWHEIDTQKREKNDPVVRSSRYSKFLDFQSANGKKYKDFFA